MASDAIIGKRISALREEAGFKQNELAKRLSWSAALLSRVESGERPLSADELNIVLSGIGTEEASRLREILSRTWTILPEPDLAEPDLDLLWQAECVALQIHELAERPDVKQFFERRLIRYEQELLNSALTVMDKRYRAAFIGTIAVGKSTAICRVEGLEIPSTKGMPHAVLETGAGGITICEVHVRKGPGHGLIIEPCTESEVRRYVTDFASFLISAVQSTVPSDASEIDGSSPGVSREVERAIRNMANLRRKRAEKKPDGTVIPAIDNARELAKSIPELKGLIVEILARMELHKRDRRDIWLDEKGGTRSPLEWLQDTFEKVNNGRHPEFTLPKRIELIVPTSILSSETLSLTLIDTQGIDDIAGRADLEQHFDDPHTVTVLCTTFNEAPSTSVRHLLTRAKEGGVRTIASNVAILALPRPGDALAVKEHGIRVQDDNEGYELKGEEVQLKLHPLGLPSIPVMFFNSAEDAPELLRAFLLERFEAVRASHRKTLSDIINGANNLLLNYEQEQSKEVMEAASHQLGVWVEHSESKSGAATGRLHDSLISEIATAHPRTVFASVVRDGAWYNLNFAHELSHGARRIATSLVEPRLLSFSAIAKNLIDDDDLAEAHDLVRQAMRLMEDGFDEIIKKAQLVGQSVYADELSKDTTFWAACDSEWGKGEGYRARINSRNRRWFEIDHHGDADSRVTTMVHESWHEVVKDLEALLGRLSSVAEKD